MLRRAFLTTPLGLLSQVRKEPKEFATSMAEVYGREVTDLVYTQTFATLGRCRLGQRADVAALLEPWLSGAKDSLAKPTASHYSGHLVLASIQGERARALLLRAADMAIEKPLDNEMSDSVFMVCPLLAIAGRLTSKLHYFDAALAHFRRMETLCRRPDGLYRHSPLAQVAWGRGNAFPLLGLALTLSELPNGYSRAAPFQQAFPALAGAISKHQTETGLWRQVIDVPDSWPEYSCTAMIAAALYRGVRRGWLPGNTYRPRIQQAWIAIQARTQPDGGVLDVCESTGRMRSLEEYLQRKAIRGRDPRGGAMGLFLGTELAGLPTA